MGSSIVSDRLDTYARMHGGFRAFDFSQAQAFKLGDPTLPDQGKTYKMVLRNNKPMGGVCATLCAFWVAFHSSQDSGYGAGFTKGRSVWDYLFSEGGINVGAATNITVEHHRSSGNQINFFENFLKNFHVVRRTRIVGGKTMQVTLPLSQTRLIAAGEAIVKATNGYKLLSLRKGTGGGHMVAAFAADDVLFMDPNYGEFWLPNARAFRAWWLFFIENTYLKSYDSLIVREYGVAAR
ncbi:YopT-type cysteine protease domain-containing protein [Paraburkholderia xenovorans]|uniref:YopT-type cysteine protease domain-containing protein n=1 Tax=Paraburkholderia xenovorans TaxID=36873 RepID=UPI0038BBB728